MSVLPFDVIFNIASYLDVCTLWALADTCRAYRYEFLESPSTWRRLVIDMKYCDVKLLYASLRRFRDTNGLRPYVQEVVMDGNDSADISPIVMLVKFPNLRTLSARQRRFNTNIEADTKVLQDMIRNKQLQPGTLPLTRVNIYHYNMMHEPHLAAFQRTLNRLSKHDSVSLDIRPCCDNGSLVDAMQRLHLDGPGCARVVSDEARCWACGYSFTYCFVCNPICPGCRSKRLPPLANDQKIGKQNESEDDPDFSVF